MIDLPTVCPYRAVAAGTGAAACWLAVCWSVATMAQATQESGVSVTGVALLGLAAVAGRAVLITAERAWAIGTADAARTALRRDLAARLFSGGPVTAGPAANALLDQVDRVGPYYSAYLPSRWLAAVVPLLVLAVVFPVNWLVGLVLALTTPLMIMQVIVFGRKADEVAEEHASETSRLSGYFLDRLQGLATLRALDAVDGAAEGIARASDGLARRSMAVLRVAFLTTTALDAAVTLAIAVTATYVGLTLLHYVQLTPMTLREGLFLLLATPAYFAPFRALAAAHHARADAMAALQSIQDVPSAPASPMPHQRTPGACFELAEVTVRYPNREFPALHDVSAAFPVGSITAVTGASGAGKSTLLALLAGRLAPSDGTVSTTGGVTWIGQRPYLFAGTIADNIALAKSDATRAELTAAAAMAQLSHLPLDRVVGERGHGISGGEVQRVALARALLAAQPLLLLDEPSAHLDAAIERTVCDVLAGLRGRYTIVMATHSPALRSMADTVLHLDRGRVLA